MSLAVRKRIAVAVLAAFATWPAAHHLLAVRYGFDPWRFFGWSMYAVPDARVEVKVVEMQGGAARLVDPPPDAAGEWAFRRAVFGRLASPEELARRVLRERPGIDGVAIRVRRFVLDRETARIRSEDEIHRFGRDEPVRQ